MYFPKSQIKPSQFTNGGELREKVTKNEYRGYFFQTSTNLFYSGKYPEDSPSIELERIPQISTGNNNEELFSDEGADDFVPNEPVSVVEETNYFNLPRAYLESNSTVLKYTKPPRRPIQSYVSPTKTDYELGEFQRYFLKRINSNIYIEVTNTEYQLFLTKNNKVQYHLYICMQFPWIITGKDRKKVGEINYKTLKGKEKKFKIIGLVEKFKEKYSQFFKALNEWE